MKPDVMQQVVNYLHKVPAGTSATVQVAEAKKLRYFRKRDRPLHELVTQWAEMHGFKFSCDRPDPAVATQYHFRKKDK